MLNFWYSRQLSSIPPQIHYDLICRSRVHIWSGLGGRRVMWQVAATSNTRNLRYKWRKKADVDIHCSTPSIPTLLSSEFELQIKPHTCGIERILRI